MSKIETLQGVGEFVGRFVSTPCTLGSSINLSFHWRNWGNK